MKNILRTCVYLFLPNFVLSLNPIRHHQIQSSDIYLDKYLRHYGYLNDQAVSSDVPALTDTRTAGLRFFQSFNHLNVTGVLDSATLRLLNTPRCGCPDIRTSSEAENYALGTKWRSKTDLTWKLITPTAKLTETLQRSELARAFKLWSDVAAITFTETTGTADINILFAVGDHGNGDPFEDPFDGPGGVLAHAFFPEDGRTHFDDEENWVVNSNSGIDFFTVAAHEIGHAIGLDHSQVQTALMAPFYSGYDPNFALDSDDIAGARALYGPAVVITTTTAAVTSTTTSAVDTTTATTTGTITTLPDATTTVASTSTASEAATTTTTVATTTTAEPTTTSLSTPSSSTTSTQASTTSVTSSTVSQQPGSTDSSTGNAGNTIGQKNTSFIHMVLSLCMSILLAVVVS